MTTRSIAPYFNLYLYKSKFVPDFPKLKSCSWCHEHTAKSRLHQIRAGSGGRWRLGCERRSIHGRGCKHSQTAPQRVRFMIMIYIKMALVTLLCQVRADIKFKILTWHDSNIHWHCSWTWTPPFTAEHNSPFRYLHRRALKWTLSKEY